MFLCISTRVLFRLRNIYFKLLLIVCFIFAYIQTAHAANVTLTWDANSEANLAGYRVFHRKSGQIYSYNTPTWQGNSTNCTITGLCENTPYYFVVRAYDTTGIESPDSAEVVAQGLLVSASSDRSGAKPIAGQIVSGSIYVFIDPDHDVNRVLFYLDDPTMSQLPYSTEIRARYDFATTADDSSANPFDTTVLSDGTHNITAYIEFTSGKTQTLNGSLMIANNSSPMLSSLNITGPDSLNEGTSSNYSVTATYSDGTSKIVTGQTTWGANISTAVISDSGVLSVSSITSSQTIIITGTFTDTGITRTAQKTVTINDTTSSLSSLSITGPITINEETTNTFSATAIYSNGSTKSVTTDVSWSDNTSYANFSGKGALTTGSVPNDQSITIMASFTEDGTTKTAQKHINIKDSTPLLSSVHIVGSSLINENLNANYNAIATFSDGSTQTVTSSASWSENSIHTSINNNGVLTASEVTENVTVVITAVYAYKTVTKNAQKTVTVLDVPVENITPVKPNITTPYDGQDNCDLVFNIITEPFVDADGDAHSNSCWQISKKKDFLDTVLDVTSTKHLTSITVPHTILEGNTSYFVRVRFYDIFMAASDWSNPVTFTTALDIADSDNDGIPDDQQVSVGVDIDDNGVDDIDESENIKSVQSEDGVTRIGVYKDSETITSIDAVELIDPSTLPACANKPDILPHRMFSYRISVDSPGAIAHVTVYFDEPIVDGLRFYKYDTINGWSDYSEHATFNGDGRSITLEVQDGGYGDCDGKANGIIVDPGALGSVESSTNSSVSSGSSTGGCFITTSDFDKSRHTGNTLRSAVLLSSIIITIIGCCILINRNKIPLWRHY